jgi:hypothetical protein
LGASYQHEQVIASIVERGGSDLVFVGSSNGHDAIRLRFEEGRSLDDRTRTLRPGARSPGRCGRLIRGGPELYGARIARTLASP